jgi:excisionase family DNA binding protein
VTVQEAAKRLETVPRVVYDLCKAGVLGHHRIGVRRGVIRITEADVEAYIASRRVEPREPSPRVYPRGTGLAVRSIIGEALAEEARKAELAKQRRKGAAS